MPLDHFGLHFSSALAQKSNKELIKVFNDAIGLRAFGKYRQKYLNSIWSELDKRGIDYKLISNEESLSFKSYVFLLGNKVYRLTDLQPKQVKEIFDKYISKNHPDKLKFNPRIIEYDNDEIKFGMNKHFGVLTINTNLLL